MIPYRADIDGLRAVAVSLVVLFHFSMGLSGGFIGVDIFFVISGYLITLLIRRGLEEGDFSMKSFWMRRIRRLFPALGCMVILNVLAASFFFYPGVFRDYGKELISQVCMISNVYFAQQDGYFETPSESLPLLHTWSLAVEEQFYIIFPVALVWLWKKKSGSKSRISTTILYLGLASLFFNFLGTHFFGLANFFLLPGRAWELLIGAWLAIALPKTPTKRLWTESLGWLSLLTLILCAVTYDERTAFPGYAAIPVCVATAIIIYVNAHA